MKAIFLKKVNLLIFSWLFGESCVSFLSYFIFEKKKIDHKIDTSIFET